MPVSSQEWCHALWMHIQGVRSVDANSQVRPGQNMSAAVGAPIHWEVPCQHVHQLENLLIRYISKDTPVPSAAHSYADRVLYLE